MHTSGNGYIVEGGEVKAVGESGRVTNARIGVQGAYGKIGVNDDGSPKFGREQLYFQATAWDNLAERLGGLQKGDQFEFSGRVRSPKPYEKDGVTVYPDKTLELSTIDFTPSRNRSRSTSVDGTSQAASEASGADAPSEAGGSMSWAEQAAAAQSSSEGVEVGF